MVSELQESISKKTSMLDSHSTLWRQTLFCQIRHFAFLWVMCVWVVKRKEVHVSIEAFGKLAPLHVSLSIPHVSQITPKLICFSLPYTFTSLPISVFRRPYLFPNLTWLSERHTSSLSITPLCSLGFALGTSQWLGSIQSPHVCQILKQKIQSVMKND